MNDCRDVGDLLIDPEFERLQILISKEEYRVLVENILKYGVRRSIHTWNGYIIDGHKRFRICTEHKIPFSVRDYHFSSRWEVMEWICSQNMATPGISEEYKKYYLGKRLLVRSDPSRKGFAYSHGSLQGKDEIATELGESYGYSHSTIFKYSIYAKAIDAIYEQEPEIVEMLLNGKVLISQENVIRISTLSPDDLRIIRNCMRERDHERMQMPEIWHELRWNRIHLSIPDKQKKTVEEAKIKQMPAFDPDAELSSLSLTIPSWRGSLDRICKVSDFEIATKEAKVKLEEQLISLMGSVESLLKTIRENDNE